MVQYLARSCGIWCLSLEVLSGFSYPNRDSFLSLLATNISVLNVIHDTVCKVQKLLPVK